MDTNPFLMHFDHSHVQKISIQEKRAPCIKKKKFRRSDGTTTLWSVNDRHLVSYRYRRGRMKLCRSTIFDLQVWESPMTLIASVQTIKPRALPSWMLRSVSRFMFSRNGQLIKLPLFLRIIGVTGRQGDRSSERETTSPPDNITALMVISTRAPQRNWRKSHRQPELGNVRRLTSDFRSAASSRSQVVSYTYFSSVNVCKVLMVCLPATQRR